MPRSSAQTAHHPTVVVAEKPSVAREIAGVLGATTRRGGLLEGAGYRVTWAIGHLATLAEPHEIDPQWKRWRDQALPMLPRTWPLRVVDRTKDQFEIVKRALCDPTTERIVCATDAGREGELIFRFIYEAAGAAAPVDRLWISSLTPSAIRSGFESLRSSKEFDGLADAARARSRADWLVGMNLTRAYTLRHGGRGEVLSVGRVQTPTLAMVVAREIEIRDFVPEPYREVLATFSVEGASTDDPANATPARESYEGVWFDPSARNQARDSASRLPADDDIAERIAERVANGRARVASRTARQRKLPPPRLYDLTELQRHANRLYGYSAQKTLDIAQALYEKKLLSYPRTDSRALSNDVASTLPKVVDAIRAPYEGKLAPDTGTRPLGTRFVNDKEVGDHHALIPTDRRVDPSNLGRDAARIYDLVCRRLLAAWHADHLYSTTTVVTAVASPGAEPDADEVLDHFRSTGTQVDQPGWRVLDPSPPSRARSATTRGAAGSDAAGAAAGKSTARTRPATGEADLPAALREGLEVAVEDVQIADKKTRPPQRFTEAALLTAMETAGKTLDDRGLSEAMRETGLGTPATRAGIIETLLQRTLLEREKKSLRATDRGIRLIGLVHPAARSPAMTGQWEARLRKIQQGDDNLADFMREIEGFVATVVKESLATTRTRSQRPRAATKPPPAPSPRGVPTRSPTPGGRAPAPSTSRPAPTIAPRARAKRSPTPPEDLARVLRERFDLKTFRPHQESVCRAITRGEDTLLVMPTGAGKSLCYQLPGIARAGTTLVISPLIALMEDQVADLVSRGFAAERIHSGRSREESRAVCNAYRDGALDFLFIAPERLRVPGFVDFLARTKPTLVAIDEAHCISQWGHDFRPDYRMLQQHLPKLRPAPIVALTATATERVQEDIIEQLAMKSARREIHGFRRDNIAIEIIKLAASMRNEVAARLLAPRERRPAIVYAPTRKRAEAFADEIGEAYPAAAYHAGMEPARRDAVQAAFLRGDLDVVVATVAFGMGIDKADVRSVIHLALPASVEGYYQEIGRAGRDGAPSRAYLLQGPGDRRTLEWFLERDYPAAEKLERLYEALADDPKSYDALRRKAKLKGDDFERAFEKLWIHGGVVRHAGEFASRGSDDWRAPYQSQLRQRREQLRDMVRFAESNECRMRRLVSHFGDHTDDDRPCERCDACDPEGAHCSALDAPTEGQRGAMERILKSLAHERAASNGRLHESLFGSGYPRNEFERLLAGLHRAGLIHIEEDHFESDGERIDYRRPVITAAGRRADEAGIAKVRLPLSDDEGSSPRGSRKRRGSRRRNSSGKKSSRKRKSSRRRR
ncbi:MAG: DNA topoisomerase 3 [Myxococcota bacterium]|nr:DNA topoisomerase 3 [Myxococcota bacterium]